MNHALQALELVRGFAAAVQESNPEAQREVVQRVFRRIAIRDDQVVDVDLYPVLTITNPDHF